MIKIRQITELKLVKEMGEFSLYRRLPPLDGQWAYGIWETKNCGKWIMDFPTKLAGMRGLKFWGKEN